MTNRLVWLCAGLIIAGPYAAPAQPAEGPYTIVLGIAQDGGVPQAGRQTQAHDVIQRDVVCVAVVDPRRSLRRWLIECTPDFRGQLSSLDRIAPSGSTPGLDGIFLTHAHIGHYTGLMHLGHEVMGAKDVPVYVMPKMRDFLENNGPWRRLVAGDHISLRVMRPGESLRLTPTLTIEPIKVAHREEESDAVGFIASGPDRKLLYIPDIDDWSRWDRRIRDLVSSVDVALLDGTFYAPGELENRSMAEVPHPFITRSMDLLESLVAEGKQVVFIHLNHSNPALRPGSPERLEIEKRGFAVATDGMEFGL